MNTRVDIVRGKETGNGRLRVLREETAEVLCAILEGRFGAQWKIQADDFHNVALGINWVILFEDHWLLELILFVFFNIFTVQQDIENSRSYTSLSHKRKMTLSFPFPHDRH